MFLIYFFKCGRLSTSLLTKTIHLLEWDQKCFSLLFRQGRFNVQFRKVFQLTCLSNNVRITFQLRGVAFECANNLIISECNGANLIFSDNFWWISSSNLGWRDVSLLCNARFGDDRNGSFYLSHGDWKLKNVIYQLLETGSLLSIWMGGLLISYAKICWLKICLNNEKMFLPILDIWTVDSELVSGLISSGLERLLGNWCWPFDLDVVC